jgi:hypothetical protein
MNPAAPAETAAEVPKVQSLFLAAYRFSRHHFRPCSTPRRKERPADLARPAGHRNLRAAPFVRAIPLQINAKNSGGFFTDPLFVAFFALTAFLAFISRV